MLIEFRVKNFRSLRDEQVLSMVASSDKELRDTHVVETGLKAAPGLLKSAAIYGANASGKSTVIRALQVMREVVIGSAVRFRPGQALPGQPFRLDSRSVSEPIEFEVTFLRDGLRWQYGFAMTTERIVSEHLLVYKAFKPQRWYERCYDADTNKDVYEFGPGLKGQKQVWEAATRPNALFLSTAVQLNSEVLRPVFDWFRTELVIFNEYVRIRREIVAKMLKDAAWKERLCDFLKAADISLADIQVQTRKHKFPNPVRELMEKARDVGRKDGLSDAPGDSAHEEDALPDGGEEHDFRFLHETENGTAEFSIRDESRGTRNLLFLGAPVLDILSRGKTLLVDELDTSLHTLLVRQLVRLFNSPRTNTGNAQLIFTTHDTSLLDAEGLFRRDQIWFMEKGVDQASSLIALSEYSPRKNEALERGYLMGRYGGIPFLDRSKGLLHHGA